MGRSPCCAKEGLNRGAWIAAEDQILIDYIKIHGEGKWRNLPKKAGLKRCGKSCRLRWLNYLKPDIKRGNISRDEEDLIIRLHKLLGNRWSLIAGRLPGRTDNEIKNYWNTNFGKKLQEKQYPSSSSRKPSYNCREKPKSAANKWVAQAAKAGRESNPVWTKATKCTGVFISTPEPQKYEHHQNMAASSMAADGCVEDGDDQNVKRSESVPGFRLGENDPSDFMIDFEMDEHFLSFLHTDFSGLPNYDTMGGDSSTTNTFEKEYSAANSDDQKLLFSEDKLRDMDFPLIDSLIESEFEWFSRV